MKVDVLLINEFKGAIINERVNEAIPHIGLEFLNEYLKSQDINSVISYPTLDKETGKIALWITHYQPLVVGVSANWSQLGMVKQRAELFKKLFPKSKLIIGGPISSFHQELLEEFDAVCFGEGEQTLLEYIQQIKKGEETSNIKGLYQKGEAFTPQKEFVDLNNTPLPNYQGLDLQGCIDLSTSRGCHYGKCTFCDTTKFNPVYRVMKAKTVINWLEEIKKHQDISYVQFYDDNFLTSRLRARKILEYLSNNNLKAMFYSRADSVINFEEEIEDLSTIIARIDIGIESFSDTQLKRWNKGVSAEQNLEALQILNHNKVFNYSYMIMSDAKTTIKELTTQVAGAMIAPNIWYYGHELPFTLVNYEYNTMINNNHKNEIDGITHLEQPHNFLFKTQDYMKVLNHILLHIDGMSSAQFNNLVNDFDQTANKRLMIYLNGVKAIKMRGKNGLKLFKKRSKKFTNRLRNSDIIKGFYEDALQI